MTEISDCNLFKTGEAARILGVHVDTIRRWIHETKLTVIRFPSGHYRVPREELVRILEERGREKAGRDIKEYREE